MRITWHGHEGALHFLLMDEPVLNMRALGPDITELSDKDRRPVRLDALRLSAVPGVTYDAHQDLLDFRLSEGQAQRRLHTVRGMEVWLGPRGEAVSISLVGARRGCQVPLEDVALLAVEEAAAAGRAEVDVELPEDA